MTFDDMVTRFRVVTDRTRKITVSQEREPERPTPNPAQERAHDLGEWAARPEGGVLIAWLNQEIETARLRAHAGVGSAQGIHALGCEAGLRAVRDEMLRIRGELPGNPPGSP